MANIITSCRILCSILLLFVPAFSPKFYIVYFVAGFSDMIDGTIARKTNSANEFGSRLDTIADIAFTVACMIKLLPVLAIPTWICIWIGVIAIIKVINIISGYIVHRKFVAIHTIMNKVTGAVLFILPLTLSIVDLKYSGGFVCTIATFAAVQEGYLIIIGKMDLKERAKRLKMNIPTIYLSLRDRDTPMLAKIFAGITVVYALSPIDLVPDFIPVLGYLDDVILLPMLVAWTIKLIPTDIIERNRREAEGLWEDGKPKKWYFAIPIVLIWGIILVLILNKRMNT